MEILKIIILSVLGIVFAEVKKDYVPERNISNNNVIVEKFNSMELLDINYSWFTNFKYKECIRC